MNLFSKGPEGMLAKDGGVTMDVVYCIAVETALMLQ